MTNERSTSFRLAKLKLMLNDRDSLNKYYPILSQYMNTDTDFPEDEHPKKENENCSNED